MKRYLHLAVFRCDQCQGPVVAASVAVRENVISKETDRQEIGAICVACGYKQSQATEPDSPRHFPPTEWHDNGVELFKQKSAFVATLDHRLRD
jgi:hypothetical protein